MNKEELEKLVNDNEFSIKLVQHYEQIDNPLLYDRKGLLNTLLNDVQGVSEILSLAGYKGLIELYLATHNNCQKLQNISDHLQKNLIYSRNPQNEENDKEFAKQVLKDLEETGKAFISYINFNGEHANFIKYSKENGKYYRTFYNAGDDQNAGLIGNITMAANYISKEIVPINPVTKHSMKENYGIGKIIEEDIMESRLSSDQAVTNKQVNKNNAQRIALSSSNNSNRIVNSQKWGNCSTRCIRELLRDNIPESDFRAFYQYITNTPYSEMLKNAGIKYIPNKENIINIKTLKNSEEQIESLDKKIETLNKENDTLQKSQNPSTENYSKIKKNQEQIINNLSMISNIMKSQVLVKSGGYTVRTKEVFIYFTANEFANKNKLNSELAENLWLKMFDKSLKGIDLPLTNLLIKPVKQHLLSAIKENKKLTTENFDKILKNWQDKCMGDPSIELIIKAPILASMSEEEQRKELNLIKGYKKEVSKLEVIDIYKILAH